jgi:glutamate decarboxylase
VYQLIHDELLLDGVAHESGDVLSTWNEPEVQLMAESLDKNIIGKDEYPQTAELEAGVFGCSRRSIPLASSDDDYGNLDSRFQPVTMPWPGG